MKTFYFFIEQVSTSAVEKTCVSYQHFRHSNQVTYILSPLDGSVYQDFSTQRPLEFLRAGRTRTGSLFNLLFFLRNINLKME